MATVLFDKNIQGPPPGNATTGTDQWINLGLIPTGNRVWIGNARYASPDKSITFELRTNALGKSLSGTANTTLLDTVAVSPKNGTLLRDLYKNGRLHIATVRGTGVENWWLRLVSKSGTAGSYLFSINYTLE